MQGEQQEKCFWEVNTLHSAPIRVLSLTWDAVLCYVHFWMILLMKQIVLYQDQKHIEDGFKETHVAAMFSHLALSRYLCSEMNNDVSSKCLNKVTPV